MADADIKGLAAHEASGNYESLIGDLRDMVADDVNVLSDPWIKEWTGRRWRDLFLQSAITDEKVVDYATKPIPLVPIPLANRVPVPSILRKDNARQAVAERFLKDIRASEWQAEMPPAQGGPAENTTFIICPGLLTGLLHSDAHAFPTEAAELESERGWKFLRADLHPFRGCEANEADLEAAVARGEGFDARIKPVENPTPPDNVVLLGYSKGTPDVLSFLAHKPQYRDKVKAVFTWAGANGGSYAADDVYNQVKDLSVEKTFDYVSRLLSIVSPAVLEKAGIRRLDEYDILGAFHDLTTWNREAFFAENRDLFNTMGIPFFGITGATTPLEVPNFQFLDAVRTSAHDANNDMQLTQKQASMEMPMWNKLAMVHAHHWDLAYAPFPIHMRAASPNLDHPFPRKAAMVANWELLSELGLID